MEVALSATDVCYMLQLTLFKKVQPLSRNSKSVQIFFNKSLWSNSLNVDPLITVLVEIFKPEDREEDAVFFIYLDEQIISSWFLIWATDNKT